MAYSDQQLAAALRRAGVPAGPAAYLVATAHPESGASNVVQKGQPYATTGWGVWQITPGNSEPKYGINNALLSLQPNADAAAAKYRSQGLGAWTTITSGLYKPYFAAAQSAVAQVYHMPLSEVDKLAGGKSGSTGGGGGGGGGGGSGGGGASPAQLDAFLTSASPSGGVLADAGALLHGTAVILDRVFGLFAPGQGWRIVFGATAAGTGYASYRAFNTGGEDGDGNLPLAILLAGIAAVALFMMARPWPQTSGGPIKPGAYVVDVLEGKPPPAGPESFTPTEVHLTEAGLGAILGLWAAGKVGQSLGGIAAGAGAAGGILGKVWGWVKGLGGEAEAAAGDIAASGGEVA